GPRPGAPRHQARSSPAAARPGARSARRRLPLPRNRRPKEQAMRLRSARLPRTALTLFAVCAAPLFTEADQPWLTIRARGPLTFDDGLAVAQLHGTAPAMGRFVCYGEILFVPGGAGGSLIGEGVVAFTAA